MEDCIFCKIVGGDLPSFIVYNGREVMAFLDINPVREGHTLVIPKKHFENTFDIGDNILREIASVAKKIAAKMKEALRAEGVNFWHASGPVAGQDVFHFHLHVVPRKRGEKAPFSPFYRSEKINTNKEELKSLAEKLKIK